MDQTAECQCPIIPVTRLAEFPAQARQHVLSGITQEEALMAMYQSGWRAEKVYHFRGRALVGEGDWHVWGFVLENGGTV